MTPKKEQLTVEQLLELPGDFSEKIILKQLLRPESTDSSYFIYQNFQDRWFDNNAYSQLFKILKAYWTKYQSFPSKSLLIKILEHEKYKESKNDILTLVDDILNIKESDYDKTYLQDMIVRFTKERAIYFTVLDNISIIEKHKDLNSCFSKFEEIAKYDLNTDLGIEYFENIENHVERLNKPDLKIPTGIRGLDKVLYGGIPVDDTCLFLFMAQPGLGKSMFMANIAANWIMLGKKVLIISLEMSEHMYSMRMDSLFASININKLKDASEGLLKRIKSLKMGIPTAQLQIKEFPTGTCSAMMIKQYLKKLKEVKGFIPDLIVLDYLNIAKPNAGGSSMNMYEKGKSVAEELRAISGEFHIPLISAIQSNRGGYSSQDIDMDNASESGGIPATADCMFGVFQLDGEREANKINLKVIKNRYGGFIGDTIPLEVDYNTLQLKDWNEDYDEEDDDNSVTSIQHDKDELDKALDEL